MPQQEGGSRMSSPAVRLAAVLPAVPGDPGSALGPRRSGTTQERATAPGPAVQESGAGPAGSAEIRTVSTATTATTATTGTTAERTAAPAASRSASRPAARAGGAVARAAATWRGSGNPAGRGAAAAAPFEPHVAATATRGDEPPSGRPNKPLLAAAAIAGTVLIGTPFLFLGLGNDDHRNEARVQEVPVGGTVLENLAPNGGQAPGNDYATAAPSRKPVTPPRPGTAERPGSAPSLSPEAEKRNDGRTGTGTTPAAGGDAAADGTAPSTQTPPESVADTKDLEQDKAAGRQGGPEAGKEPSTVVDDTGRVGGVKPVTALGPEKTPESQQPAAVQPAKTVPETLKPAPKEEAPKEAAPKEAAPKKEAPKEEAPKKEAPKEAAPKKPAPAKPAARAGGALPQSANFTTVRGVPLKNAMTGMCADVPNYGKGTVDGPVNQFTCNTTAADNQLWDLVVAQPGAGPGGADLFTIRNSKDGLCLDLPNFAGQPAGTGVSEFHCRTTSADNQLWYLDKRSDGKFWIRSQSSAGRCLDVSGFYGSGGKDARLTIFDCNKRDDHLWSFS
ncbi:RICIN domain-containing protein [Streptomyces subrutilus]|uniref:RICIN domain-containing protein n=1 Tax=Streptomyces subrutilus TaxID=36818 RepID=UPI0033D1C48F